MSMDDTNRRILDLLQQDARMSYADLARGVDRAESTVRERVTAMERRGVIQGYRVQVDPRRVGLTAHAHVRAALDLSRVKDVERGLTAIPEVRRAVITTGPRPLFIEIVARDMLDLERVLEERLPALGLDGVTVDLLVRQVVPERPLRLAGPAWVNAHARETLRPALRITDDEFHDDRNGTEILVRTVP